MSQLLYQAWMLNSLTSPLWLTEERRCLTHTYTERLLRLRKRSKTCAVLFLPWLCVCLEGGVNDKWKEVCREVLSLIKESSITEKKNREASGNKRRLCTFWQLSQWGYGSISIQSLHHGVVGIWHLQLSPEIHTDLLSYNPLRALNLIMKNSGIMCDVQQPLHHTNWAPVVMLQVFDIVVAFYRLVAVILCSRECLPERLRSGQSNFLDWIKFYFMWYQEKLRSFHTKGHNFSNLPANPVVPMYTNLCRTGNSFAVGHRAASFHQRALRDDWFGVLMMCCFVFLLHHITCASGEFAWIGPYPRFKGSYRHFSG